MKRVSALLDDIDQDVIQITRTIYGPRKEPQILVTILTEVGMYHFKQGAELYI